MTRRLAAAALAAAALSAAPSAAAAAEPAFPMSLPGDASAAVRADPSTWIVGGRPGRATAALARRYGGRHVGAPSTGGYAISRARARALAAALKARRLLVYAQPDTLAEPLQAVPDDPLSGPPNDWRAKVADPNLAPPPVTPQSPLIALVDAEIDVTHPEFAGGNIGTLGGLPVTNLHGTATAAVAAAPKNNVGILGVWPGARALNVPLPDEISCRGSADQISKAVEQGAAVINMSYGSRSFCVPEYVALQFATARGVTLVAAAGNEFAEGNPLEFPASLPHVLTVAALDPNGRSAYFSNTSAAVDLSAPGVSILTAVPPALDGDGTQDGYQALSGTSFAAPMVSAAAAWVHAARPTLTVDQVAQVLRLSAVDVPPRGWDPNTGFGELSVAATLQQQPPLADPDEPNENIAWVNGEAFGKKAKPIWSGGKPAVLRALLDRFEDPADVYRLVVPAGRSARVSVTPIFGDPDLAVYDSKAQARSDFRHRVARSARRGRGQVEHVTVRNGGGKRSFYLAVTPRGGLRTLDAGYTLRVR